MPATASESEKSIVISKSDAVGGAAVASRRLTEALRRQGFDARMLVLQKVTRHDFVTQYPYQLQGRLTFLAERLRIYLANGFSHKDLFKVDSATFGLPLWRHPLVKDAGVVVLNWFNQGMLSLRGVDRICRTGKRVVWVMHDMWPLTGICHHSFSCERYKTGCGDCPFLGRGAKPRDLSATVFARKKELYGKYDNLTFVAVSHWLAAKAKSSPLMEGKEIEVVPNALDFGLFNDEVQSTSSKRTILFCAAGLDNWIKGLPTFKRALELLAARYPELAATAETVLLGEMKDPANLEGFAIAMRHPGPIDDDATLQRYFSNASVIVSCSEFESFGMTLVEGQAAGCVPVAFNRGGQSDIIDHGNTGYLAEWDDDEEKRAGNIAEGIARALETPQQLRYRMRLLSKEKFDYEAVAKKFIDTIR